MNHEQDLQRLEKLVAKDCQCSLAANSIKLHFDGESSEQGNSYIWIEPPWTLVKGDEMNTSSEDTPWETEAFHKWATLLEPLNRTRLVSYDYRQQEIFKLHFLHDYSLVMPYFAPEEGDENDDVHWYVGKN